MCGRLCLSPSSWAKEELTLREALFCFLISLQSLVSHLNAAAGEDEEGNRRRAAVFSGGRVKVYLLAHTDRPTRCTLTLSPWFVVVPLPPALTHFIHSTACLFMQITHAKSACLCLAVYLLSSCELDAVVAAVIPLVPESVPQSVEQPPQSFNSPLSLEDRWQRTLLVGKRGASTAFLLYFSVSTSSSSLCTQIRHSPCCPFVSASSALCLLYNRINLLNKTAEES